MDEMNNQMNENDLQTVQETPQQDAPEQKAPKTFVQTFKGVFSKKNAFFLLIVVVAVITIVTTLLLLLRKSPIEKFFIEMKEAESYQLEMTVSDIPFVGTINMKQMVDGNVSYTSAIWFQDEQYEEKVGKDVYVYTKNEDGMWTKEKQIGTSTTDALVETYKELLDYENYEKVKGEKNTYILKEDVKFDEFENVTLIIEDDQCTVKLTVKTEGMSLTATIVVSKLGEVELTLPNT